MEEKMKKNIWTICTLALIAVMALAGCKPAATPTQAPAPNEAAPAETPVPAATQPSAPAAGAIDCTGVTKGDTVSMLYQWSGVEETKLNEILKPLADAC